MVCLWVPIDDCSCGGNGILASNCSRGWVERLRGHHGHAPVGSGRGGDNHVVDAVGSAEIQAIIAQIIIDTTL